MVIIMTISKANDKVVFSMFDNKTIVPPIPRKPHIKLVEGFWRVSPKPRRTPTPVYWDKAHLFVRALNVRIYQDLLKEV